MLNSCIVTFPSVVLIVFLLLNGWIYNSEKRKKKENDWNDGQDISDFAYDSVSDTYDSIYRILEH